ncbi:nucleolar complex protein 2 homolog isoform X1 [Panicum virgatum]|uniref:Nucleolar complex protein 2 homolog n=1 Tax=Panicum virgatum TaxID=38727 RepID=A0A8T0V3B5_PANVG|nr:nucleolar complex protein 2 homolog isoform X1 [Panicum virgatum]KAG2630922.1 hypothetical protein PVAP13_3KG557400 [Panicum virgatum]
MAKKLGKKARKFARKNLQSAAKRNRKIRNQFNHRRPRRGGSGAREDGDDDVPQQRVDDATMATHDAADALIDGLEFPEDDIEIDADLSDSNGYLSEDPGCPYYSDSEDGEDFIDSIPQDGLDRQNDEMNLDIKKQKKKLKKLLDKDPEFANFLEKWQSELESYRSKEDSEEEDGMDSMDDDDDSNDANFPNTKILTTKTISEWCQLVSKEPKSPALRNLLNAFRDACRYGVHSDSPSMQRFQCTRVFYQIISFVLSESDNIFRALLEISDDANKGQIMNMRNSKKWQPVDPLLKSYLRNSLELLSQLTDNKILSFVLTRLRASLVLFSAYPSTSSRLLKILFRLWASGDQSLSLSAFLMIREVAALLPDCLDLCLTKAYNTYLASTKLVNDRNTKHIDFLMNCLVELYSLDVQKSCERAVTSVGQLNAILRQASKTKEKEDLRKIDNWQYINCVNLWVRFLCCNYKDYNLNPLFYQVLQVIRGVAHLFPGTRYLPLRLKLVQMLNELSTCSQMFFPIPSSLFDCLEFREVSQKEQTQKTKVNFSSLLKVSKSLLKSRDFQEECVLSAIQVLSAHFAQWSYHVSFPEVATIPLILLKRLHEQTTIESLHRPVKRLIDQVNENKDFIERKREVVSFSPNDKASVDSFLQEEKSSGNASFTRFYASVAENHQPRGRKAL